MVLLNDLPWIGAAPSTMDRLLPDLGEKHGFTGFSSGSRVILVPVDFSSDSLAALHQALTLAGWLGSMVVALHVLEDPRGSGIYPGVKPPGKKRLRRLRDKAADRMARFIRDNAMDHRASKAGLRLKTTFARGAPVAEILEAAEQHEASLIVLGVRGASGLGPPLMGSTAERVVRLAAGPVLVVKG